MKRNSLNNISEIELVELARDPNKSVSDRAFNEIYRRFNKAIAFFILKKMGGTEANNYQDREDMLQMVFIRVYKGIDSYEPNFKLMTWIMRIAKNLIVDEFRKKSLSTVKLTKTDEDGEESELEIADTNSNPENRMIKNQNKEFVQKLINDNLNDDYKHIIDLVFFQQKSYQEISEELKIPLGTVKAKIHRAKLLLESACKDKTIMQLA